MTESFIDIGTKVSDTCNMVQVIDVGVVHVAEYVVHLSVDDRYDLGEWQVQTLWQS